MSKLDLLIFGATGFTGKHCLPYVNKLVKEKHQSLKWGVAGRSETKLKAVLKEFKIESIPIILADVNDQDSLLNMAKQTKVILNCTGPYRFYGEPVVKACIEAGTHHLDVSGEPEFLENVQVKYHEAANEKGIYIVGACGLDSIPTDLGIEFIREKFDGTLNSVETYLTAWSETREKGSAVNYGTWESLVYGASSRQLLAPIRKQLYATFQKIPKFVPKLDFHLLPHTPKVGDGWALPFPGADRSVAKRTQQYLYENENLRPIQVGTYVVFPNILAVLVLAIYATIFAIFLQFECGRKLLLNYPSWFTGGYFSKNPPSEAAINSSWFSVDFYGQGWSEKLPNKDDQYSTAPNKTIKGRVKGRNPGYGATCLCLVYAGIVVLTERNKLANNGKGGVYPPGAAFAKTTLIRQLNDAGVTFEILN